MTLSYSIVDLDSARHDVAGAVPGHKVVVCSSPRTGSYLLCEAMRRAGIGVPHEYFNPPTMRVLTRRWGLRMPERVKASAWWRFGHAGNLRTVEAYLGALTQRRTRNAIFAAKIQYWQYERLLDNPLGAAFLDGARFIYLTREDLLGQAISFRLAEFTGKWGVDGIATTTARRRRDLLDVAALGRAVAAIRAEDEGWRRFFKGRPPLSLSYEAMRGDPLAAAKRLAGDLVPADAPESLPPAPPSGRESDEARDMKARMREAYLAARPLPERDQAERDPQGT